MATKRTRSQSQEGVVSSGEKKQKVSELPSFRPTSVVLKEKKAGLASRSDAASVTSGVPALFLKHQQEKKLKEQRSGKKQLDPSPNNASRSSSSFRSSISSSSSAYARSSTSTSSTSTRESAHPPLNKSNSLSKVVTSGGKQGLESIKVAPTQKRNPMLKYIKNQKWEFMRSKQTASQGEANKQQKAGTQSSSLPAQPDYDPSVDYILGSDICALFLSVKYHTLHPDYILSRFNKMTLRYRLQVLLCKVDLPESTSVIQDLSILAMNKGWTLILGWSDLELARYAETFKQYEAKPADIIQTDRQETHKGQVEDVLTRVPGVNKTNVQTLLMKFGSFKRIVEASMEDLSLCVGIGEKKVKLLHQSFQQPFKSAPVAVQQRITKSLSRKKKS